MNDLINYGWMLCDGALLTLAVGISSLIMALALGLIMALIKIYTSPFFKNLANLYTGIIRGIPELVLLLLIYYQGSILLQHIALWVGHKDYININAFVTGVITLGFIYGAYATEVFRGAILAIPKGQIEAAAACGMSRFLIIKRILLPLLLRFALPGIGNVWLVLLKATAIISVIGLDELTRKAHIAAGATRNPFLFFLTAALIYLIFTNLSMIIIRKLEIKANQGFIKN
ncbi:MAG: ABC transporter permease subunit [Alphaproteobacteria bacterium]|nr:ABC transporter permease subunit [Alphaproteobacteria bacterium]